MEKRMKGWRVLFLQVAAYALTGLGLTACGGGGNVGTPAGASGPTPVSTNEGPVLGATTATMREYLGIPYAAPPVGALRWQPPQPHQPWTTPIMATSFAPHCPQTASPFGTASTSEDCLYLNVFAPSGPGPFPVMVWIHGGALVVGQSDLYDPTAMVAQGVVVVTINYRLGALGFLTLPGLGSVNGSAGNYGLLDQQAALQWVQTNIAGFGGDPSNVTLFGESAGGLSTHSQIVSPLAKGLFHKAIVESGAYSLTAASMAQANTAGTAFASAAGCPTASVPCLMALPVSTILANNTLVEISGTGLPTVDGVVLPTTIAAALASGKFNQVPVIEGNNQHEYSLLSAVSVDFLLGHEIGTADYPGQINAVFGPTLGAAVQAEYPLTLPHTPAWIYDNALTDLLFACNGRSVAQLLNSNAVPVYTYEFADPTPPLTSDVIFPPIPPRKEGYGAYHSSEIQFVFPGAGNLNYLVAPVASATYTSAETALSTQMVGFWTQFAKSGNPNASGSTTWPAYTAANDTYLSLTPGAVAPTTSFATFHNCAFWTGVGL